MDRVHLLVGVVLSLYWTPVPAQPAQDLGTNERAQEPGSGADEQAEKPAFVDGKTAWYWSKLLAAEDRVRPSECKKRFGAETATQLGETTDQILCFQAELAPISDATIDAYYDGAEKNALLPPTKQRSKWDIWKKLVDSQFASQQCPKGMKKNVSKGGTWLCPDVEDREKCKTWAKPEMYLYCKATISRSEFCPGGSYRPSERQCVDRICPEGSKPLSKAIGDDVPGCIRCEKGVFDLAETIAAFETDRDGFIHRLYARMVGGVLCRVGPPTRPKPKPRN